MSSDATHPKALSASNSSELAGTRHSYAAFSMAWQKHEAKRDCPDVWLATVAFDLPEHLFGLCFAHAKL